MSDILGVMGVGHHSQADCVDLSGMSSGELRVSIPVAGLAGFDQIFLRWLVQSAFLAPVSAKDLHPIDVEGHKNLTIFPFILPENGAARTMEWQECR